MVWNRYRSSLPNYNYSNHKRDYSDYKLEKEFHFCLQTEFTIITGEYNLHLHLYRLIIPNEFSKEYELNNSSYVVVKRIPEGISIRN